MTYNRALDKVTEIININNEKTIDGIISSLQYAIKLLSEENNIHRELTIKDGKVTELK
jgi:hypothetical protein